MRDVDDFVVLAKQMGSDVIGNIESRLEGKFQLEINREKTRVVDLREKGASLDFLGCTFRYDRDLKGRYQKCLYPTGVYWEIDWFVRSRLIRYLQRRSQRPYHPAKGEAWYSHLQRLGLVCLARPSESGPVHA